MRAPAVSFANKLFAASLAALLTFTLLPAAALAEGEGDSPSTEESQEDNSIQAEEAVEVSPRRVVAESQGLSAPSALPDPGSAPDASSAEGGTLAASLMGRPVSFVYADVALDGEPVIGSFTVDGLTFAANPDGLTLVAVSSDFQQVMESQDEDGSPAAPMLASGHAAIPESVTYNDVEYAVTSIGAYAFYLSGATSVELPASIVDVDDRAFRSSDVASVEVAEGNPSYSSFDGALYDADQLSLLLIPEGKQGTVLLPKTAESAPPSVFSHCPLVTQVSVEEGSAAFASENGLLYDASLTTLLRVPAGATDITIREGCATIAAGAMEACASLATINAPASMTSISSYLFEQEPETIMAPVAVAAVEEDVGGSPIKDGEPSGTAPQITALVALSASDDGLPKVDPSAVEVSIPVGSDETPWRAVGLDGIECRDVEPSIVEGGMQQAGTYAADVTVTINMNGGTARVDEAGGVRKSVHVATNTYAIILSTSGRAWHNSGSPTIMSDFQRTGYSFKGWSTNSTSNPQNCNSATVYKTDGSKTYYAIWAPIITINMNGGDAYFDEAGSRKTVHSTVNDYAVIFGSSGSAWHNSGSPRIFSSVARTGYSLAGWSTNPSCSASNAAYPAPYWSSGPQTYYAIWSANSYTVEYWNKAGTVWLSSDTGFKYDEARNLAAKPSSGISTGYTAVGWATSTGQSSASYGFGTSQKNLATSGTKQLFLAETANTYTISFSANGGSGSVPSDIAATYDQSHQVTAPALSRTGYSFDGWATSEAGEKAYEKGGPFKNLTSTANGKVTLYAHWSPNTYTVTFDAAGGTVASDISATYDQELTLPASTRQGYAFAGWKDEATGTTYQAGNAKNLTAASNATVKLVAQWDPVIAAEVPLYATAKVDLLGIEEQQQAQAYIKSLCGEPLRVACIELMPLPGGRELFGDAVSQVRLEAYAGADAVPVFSLTIGGTTFLSGGESLLALKMEGYGDEVPISYRFDIPDELLPSLVEATKPVCQVAYTVGRA